ncbi:thyroid adenoma-associated protein [Anaeramoeba ignava]|uniref:Thyroid adenoma-associated protein n=1 Tax=Anaeramoeba ignava TaxID=1746090 RepID=A0A9Q0L5V9_ANAIG|nr:thyroid adenoma-associated protein [Anaeramoeba ignava]
MSKNNFNLMLTFQKTGVHGSFCAMNGILSEISLEQYIRSINSNGNIENEKEITKRWKETFVEIINISEKLSELTLKIIGVSRKHAFSLHEKESNENDENNENNENHDVEDISGDKTDQIICSWLAMKELLTLLTNILQQVKFQYTYIIDKEHQIQKKDFLILPPDDIERIGRLMINLILNTRHKGVIERGEEQFERYCEILTEIQYKEISSLKTKWMNELFQTFFEYDTAVLRRSGALPPIFLSLLRTEKQGIAGETPKDGMIQTTINRLLEYARLNVVNEKNQELLQSFQLNLQKISTENTSIKSKIIKVFSSIPTDAAIDESTTIHSLNILRAIFRDSVLSKASSEYLLEGFLLSLYRYNANHWEIRNAGSLCYTTLISKTLFSKTKPDKRVVFVIARDFFNQIPGMYQFLLNFFGNQNTNHTFISQTYQQAEEKKSQENKLESNHYLHSPMLYPILLLLSSIHPNPFELPNEKYSMNPFKPYLFHCLSSQDFMIRNFSIENFSSFNLQK